MEKTIKATELLQELGYTASSTKSGPAAILRALNALGITPCGQRVLGQGISFDVSLADAEAARRARKNDFPAAEVGSGGRARRDTRTVARAILDLYSRLGEEPHALNEIRRIAER